MIFDWLDCVFFDLKTMKIVSNQKPIRWSVFPRRKAGVD